VNFNETVIIVNFSITTLTFTAPSLPDGVFSGTVVVMVTVISRFGIGPASNPVTAEITGIYIHMYNDSMYNNSNFLGCRLSTEGLCVFVDYSMFTCVHSYNE